MLLSEERIRDICRDNGVSYVKVQGLDTIQACLEAQHALDEEEINQIVCQCDYDDSKISCPIPITPLRYEKAVAHAQAIRTRAQCELEKEKEIGEILNIIKTVELPIGTTGSSIQEACRRTILREVKK